MVTFFAAWSHLRASPPGPDSGGGSVGFGARIGRWARPFGRVPGKVGAFAPIFYSLACVTGVLTVASVLVPLPRIWTLTDVGLPSESTALQIGPAVQET